MHAVTSTGFGLKDLADLGTDNTNTDNDIESMPCINISATDTDNSDLVNILIFR